MCNGNENEAISDADLNELELRNFYIIPLYTQRECFKDFMRWKQTKNLIFFQDNDEQKGTFVLLA